MSEISKFSLSDIHIGQFFSFDSLITERTVSQFTIISGDISPLHQDDGFARLRGFKSRVVHGVLLNALVSKLIGVHLPGENCLLLSMNIKYLLPVYINDLIRLTGTVEQISPSSNAVSIKIIITDVVRGCILSTGKVVVGFTN